MDILILIPIYNDWNAAAALLPQLDLALQSNQIAAEVVFIDDGSSVPRPVSFVPAGLRAVARTTILELRLNLGHQRALAVGLAWAETRRNTPFIGVMDGDGEDVPSDLVRLLDASGRSNPPRIVFAGRAKRSEGKRFRLGYKLYQLAFRALAGIDVNFGNFSVLPRRDLGRLVASADLWNHYAAAIIRSRIPFLVIPTERGTRLDGHSQMNVLSLVAHGLSAVAVFSDRVGVRLLAVTGAVTLACVVLLLIILCIRFFTDLAIPGWTTSAAGLVVVMLLLLGVLLGGFSLMILKGRDSQGFLPLRDYSCFVAAENSEASRSPRILSE